MQCILATRWTEARHRVMSGLLGHRGKSQRSGGSKSSSKKRDNLCAKAQEHESSQHIQVVTEHLGISVRPSGWKESSGEMMVTGSVER